MIFKNIASFLSPGGRNARLSILIFHRVRSQIDPLFPDEPDIERFDQILDWLGKWLQILPLDVAISQLGRGVLPPRAAAITFDDGYADNATNALPILLRHGMTATFFVTTSFMDGGRMWNDTIIEAIRRSSAKFLDLRDAGLGLFKLESIGERRLAIETVLGQVKYFEPVRRLQATELVQKMTGLALPDDLMMTSAQVSQLSNAGMQIGAHTSSHPILANLSDSEALEEIRSSKVALETVIDEPVSLFAYPNGKPGKDYLSKHAAMVRQAGFSAAVSSAPGVSSVCTDIFQLPRFTPWGRTRLEYGTRLMLNLRAVSPEVVKRSPH